MFFVASKAFWLLAQPISLVLLLVLAGLTLLIWRRRKSAIVALSLAALIHGLLGFTSLGYLLIQPLEDRFSVPAPPPAEVGAIVMLGGATMGRPSTARQIAELNQAGDRLTTTLWLARRYPEARIVLSGGSSLFDETESEAETMRRFLVGLGVAEARIVLEAESRNTAENAAFTGEALGNIEGEVVLVTSAFHMPRSVGLYRADDIAVVPWPTDYRSSGIEEFGLDLANPNQNVETATIAIREWIGLVAYRATGRIGEWFPGP
ncbi:YdcF family protein [Devosia sp. YIM 151766]|uniref:YdcF family protein n=1 Tax=Devosia sp. YIM 151766 TaxID=3017325 RepID=UPI00255C5A6B|nr:YdcF family protein [Devosia sp. YIM 151766]WIY51950.1 YdcF family protein [Devosia sp. YIM 151766]